MPTADLLRLAYDLIAALPDWLFVFVLAFPIWLPNIRSAKARRESFEKGIAKAAASRAEATSWKTLTAQFPSMSER